MKLGFFVFALFAALVSSQDVEVDSGVTISSAERAIDISSQVVKYVTELHIENGGKGAINYILYALSSKEDKHLSFIGATADSKSTPLKVSRATLKGPKSDAVVYKIELLSQVAVGGKTTVKVEAVLAQYLNPYPSHITQAEQQFVLYDGNAHILSPYAIKKETTNIALYPGQVESFTKVEPSKQDGGKITYGPYENTPALTTKEIRIHYENNSPFVVATHFERVIEVSHWGNIAIEEHLELVHKGAILKGSFSRLDFQMDRRGNKQPAVKSYKTLLPAAAKDVYYRDEIGNISTSNLRQTEEAVELEIRPRFPLYGGWKTNYVIGYNTPSYEYLFSSGNQFALKMRFLDHVFDNAVVEDMTVKIILPEGAKNIKLDPPYKVKRSPDELHYTYLDTTGRPVIIAHKTNLVEAHIQEFTLHYEFDRTGLWREPFIAIVAFYILFVAVIIWVRFDFTIATDATSESRLKVQSLVEQVADAHGQRMAVYEQYTEVINKFKASKDATALASAKKKVENDLKNVTQLISDYQAEMKASSPEVSDKIGELQKQDKVVKEQLANYQQQVERLVGGKIQKAQFTDSEKAFTQKMDELKGKMDNLVYGL